LYCSLSFAVRWQRCLFGSNTNIEIAFSQYTYIYIVNVLSYTANRRTK